jgi:hypothetical protein
MISQALRIVSSTQTGGTAATGSNSPVNGTSQFITSSVAMSTRPRRTTCRDHLRPPSPFSSLRLRMSWSWVALQESSEAMASLP